MSMPHQVIYLYFSCNNKQYSVKLYNYFNYNYFELHDWHLKLRILG